MGWYMVIGYPKFHPCGGFRKMGVPQLLDGLFHGKSQSKIDEYWWFGRPLILGNLLLELCSPDLLVFSCINDYLGDDSYFQTPFRSLIFSGRDPYEFSQDCSTDEMFFPHLPGEGC